MRRVLSRQPLSDLFTSGRCMTPGRPSRSRRLPSIHRSVARTATIIAGLADAVAAAAAAAAASKL